MRGLLCEVLLALEHGALVGLALGVLLAAMVQVPRKYSPKLKHLLA